MVSHSWHYCQEQALIERPAHHLQVHSTIAATVHDLHRTMYYRCLDLYDRHQQTS